MPSDDREEELAIRQDARLYPVGRALRDTYHAENHDTLGKDVTALMLTLARIDDAPAKRPAPAENITPSAQSSLLARVRGAIGWRSGR